METNMRDEILYCVRLVTDRGSAEVPAESITGYLQTQAVMAKQAGEPLLQREFSDAATYWGESDYEEALRTLTTLEIRTRPALPKDPAGSY